MKEGRRVGWKDGRTKGGRVGLKGRKRKRKRKGRGKEKREKNTNTNKYGGYIVKASP